MAKLDTGRMSDATKVKQVDNQHAALELALEDIFGIPDGTEIDPSIFGSVNSDGTIGGTPRLKTAGQKSDVDEACGFEFNDGTKRKKIAYVNSVLTIQEYIDGAWVQIASLEQAGTGTLQACTDVDITTMESGKLLQVNLAGDKFELVDPASVDGIHSFAELDEAAASGAYPYDLSPYSCFNPAAIDGDPAGDVGGLLYVKGANEIGVIAPPDGVGDPSVIALRCTKSSSPGDPVATVPKWFSTPQGTYSQCYGWEDYVSGGIAGYVQEAVISPNGSKGGYYITLKAGIYNVQFQYYRSGGSEYGVRSWRINSPGTVYGPATQGVVRPALVRINVSGGLTAPVTSVRDLGSELLFVPTDDTKIYLEVQQDSGVTFSDIQFALTIYKVK